MEPTLPVSENLLVGKRIADETVYNNLDFYDSPKEYFSLALDEIKAEFGEPESILDVGSANGAFLHHAKKRFSASRLKGIEPVESLVTLSRKNLANDIEITHGGLFDRSIDAMAGNATAVTFLGVMGIFFDPAKVMSQLCNLTAPNGGIFVFSPFNEEPIDVVLNYRRAPDSPWETGHNLFSMKTMESVCAALGLTCRWRNFEMAGTITKSDDPMRSWTEPFRGNKNHLFYGTNMFSTMKLLVLRKS